MSSAIYSSKEAKHKIAFAFPGQGSQYTGMGRDLACQFPQFFSVLEEANHVFRHNADETLSNIIYPIPVFTEADRKQQDETLRQTQNAQPAIGAVSLGALNVLCHFGIEADVALGHSYGELTALHAAGYYDPESFYYLSRVRGELMNKGEGDRGTMLAVVADYDRVKIILKENDIDLVIANHNSPNQVVLSGASDQVDMFATIAKSQKIRVIRLPVAAAFHSSFVADAAKPFAEAIAKIQFQKNKLPVLSNTTGEPYPDGRDSIKQLLAEQLANPVHFVEQIERLYTDGIDTFIEVGPGKILTGLIGSILSGKSITNIAIDASAGRQQGQYDLALLLATLAAKGIRFDLKKWDACSFNLERSEMDSKPAMTIAISGANYMIPREPRPPEKLKSDIPKPNTSIDQMMNKNNAHAINKKTLSNNTKQQTKTTSLVPNNGLLQATQESILALQKMQEHISRLHQQYLEGQETAQQTIQRLLEQQQCLMAKQALTTEPVFVKTNSLVSQQQVKPVLPKQEETIQQAVVKEIEETRQHSDVDIDNLLLKVVSEKTGYPLEMLSLDMSLDTDLGIDSIKRVEILSALQEKLPWSAAVNPEELGTFQFLQHIVEFIVAGRPATEATDESINVTAPPTTKSGSNFENMLLDVVAEKTGYPVEMLDMGMDMDSDLGIDSIKRVEILSALQDKIPDLPVIAAADLVALQTLQQIIDYMQEQVAGNQTSTTAITAKIDVAPSIEKESGIIRNIVHITKFEEARQPVKFDKTKEIWINKNGGELAEKLAGSLKASGYKAKLVKNNRKPTGHLAGLLICSVSEPDKQWLFDAFKLIQSCGPTLKESKGLLTSITTLGGSFGFDSHLKASANQAGLCGITKTADKEWPGVICKSIDIDPDSVSIDSIQQELFLQGPLEILLKDEQTLKINMEQESLTETAQKKTLLDKHDLIVISGGARGVTAGVAIKLAENYQCKLLLLGRSPEPEAEPEWLVELNDTSVIKKAILDNAKENLNPVKLEKRYQSVLVNREIKSTLDRIERAGSKVQYVSVDVTNSESVVNVINFARVELGNVTGLIHAAGVLADRLIEDKTEQQFNSVYATKVEGLQNLLSVTTSDKLKLMVLFSSTTARLGRKGQVDYAASNEILNKIAQRENLERKDCKVLSVNWGPWDGGMVTPALKKIFAEEGVGVIGLNAGADYLIGEIESEGPVETVILGDVPGGSENSVAAISLNQSKSLKENTDMKLAFERDLSVSSYAFLRSHVMNGQAVLPVAIILEWFAHGALHLNPGMQFHGFDDFRAFKGVTLKAQENIQLSILAGNVVFRDTCAYVPVELRSNEYLHASAVIILADIYEENVLPKLEAVTGHYQFKQGEYYQNGQLFHGQHLQGIKEVLYCSDEGVVADVNSAPSPTAWMTQPIRSNWLTDPLILDSAFQIMILWSFKQQGIGSLPTAFNHYRQYQRRYPKQGARIVAQVNEYTNNRANASIEFIDNVGNLIAAMDGYECVRDGSLQSAFKENDLAIDI